MDRERKTIGGNHLRTVGRLLRLLAQKIDPEPKMVPWTYQVNGVTYDSTGRKLYESGAFTTTGGVSVKF